MVWEGAGMVLLSLKFAEACFVAYNIISAGEECILHLISVKSVCSVV